MSAKVDILAFASRISGIAPDQVLLDHDFDDVVLNLDPTEVLCALVLHESVGDASYAVPKAAIRLLGTWFDTRQLSREIATSLEAVTAYWRDDKGMPTAFVTVTEGDRRFRLYPKPDTSSGDQSFPHGLPFGIDFPAYSPISLTTEARTDLPDFLDLPVALAMLARHFAREERYRDPTFASVAKRVADRLLAMVT